MLSNQYVVGESSREAFKYYTESFLRSLCVCIAIHLSCIFNCIHADVEIKLILNKVLVIINEKKTSVW